MSETRCVVDKFLDDLGRIDVREPDPLHVINDRLALAAMVLTEVEEDDLEGLALLALAERTRDLCFEPTSVAAAALVQGPRGRGPSRPTFP